MAKMTFAGIVHYRGYNSLILWLGQSQRSKYSIDVKHVSWRACPDWTLNLQLQYSYNERHMVLSQDTYTKSRNYRRGPYVSWLDATKGYSTIDKEVRRCPITPGSADSRVGLLHGITTHIRPIFQCQQHSTHIRRLRCDPKSTRAETFGPCRARIRRNCCSRLFRVAPRECCATRSLENAA
jgi:hypothetical protein